MILRKLSSSEKKSMRAAKKLKDVNRKMTASTNVALALCGTEGGWEGWDFVELQNHTQTPHPQKTH